MKITAHVQNTPETHTVEVQTNDTPHPLTIAPKAGAPGSSVNGGELLFLALATCYCNDIYREAAKRNIQVERVEVTVEGLFGGEGDPASDITYRATVAARADADAIRDLMYHTDTVAEIQNTLRLGLPVRLAQAEAVPL
jgi:organic hydroperoxide reductase OsmC/OhrA